MNSVPREISDEVFAFPASFAQRRLWIIDQMDPGRPTYNVPLNVKIAGALDVAALEASFTYVIERHEALRTVFETEDGAPVQVVLPPMRVMLPVVDLRQFPPGEQDAEVARLLNEEGRLGFDLRIGPLLRITLLRLASNAHVLLLTVHHIVFDGWSTGVLQREISAAYAAFSQGELPALPELPIQYADFSVWQRDQLNGQQYDEHLAYWTDHLRRPLPTLELLTDRPRHLAHDHVAGHVAVGVPLDTTNALLALARGSGATPFTVLLTAFQVLLHRYTGQDDIIVGSPVAGRSQVVTEGLIGCFVNTIALRADLSGDPSFRALLDRTRTTVTAVLAHQDLPFDKVVEAVHPKRQRTRNPIFETLFSLNDLDAEGTIILPGLATTDITGLSEIAKFDLQLLLRSAPEGFYGSLEFDTNLYDVDTMERLALDFKQLLQSIAAEPDRPVAELELLSAEERQQVVNEWNATDAAYAGEQCVHKLFEAQVARTPDAVAVLYEDQQLTYAELNARANQLAQYLQGIGVGPGDLVGICAERSIELLVATLGVLKAGGAYVPLDPEYPLERLAFMVDDAAVRVLISQSHLISTLPPSDARVVLIDADWQEIAQMPAARSVVRTTESDPTYEPACMPAYMIYTSGSTGRPKGALNAHRGICNRLLWMQQRYQLTAADTVLQKTPFSFDVSVWELFWPLVSGARLVMAQPGGHRDPSYLVKIIADYGVTVLHFVPTMLRAFLAEPSVGHCTSLRHVMCSGEVLAPELIPEFFSKLDAELHNLYGPTEAAVDVTHWTCPRDFDGTIAPLGKPVANTRLYILDRSGAPVPIGVAGELYIGGVQVGIGYHRRPELTRERFIPDVFSGEHGARLYRTGDRARYLADGNVEYLGRLDDQVKLRGYRIELGEIEAALATHPAVQHAAAVIREITRDGATLEKRLLGYYVQRPGHTVSETQLRTHLRDWLASYMIPDNLMAVKALPIGPSGKVDRAALAATEAVVSHELDSYASPRTPIEHELVRIWEELLPNRRIGIHDDFFDIGGHSLLALQMLFRIEQVRGRRLSLASIFENTTIDGIGLLLESALQAEGEPRVLVLQEMTSGPPFAFVHGDLHGGGWYCRRLAPLIGTESPLILFPTFGPDVLDAPVSIEAIAAANLRELRKEQPSGPYRLGGFCLGGLIAFEMARQLKASGEVVQRLVLIDSTADNARFRWLEPLIRVLSRSSDEERRIERRAKLVHDLEYYSDRVVQVYHMSRREQLDWLRTNVTRYLPGAGVARASVQVPDDNFQSRRGMKTLRFQRRAASAFIPGAYTGDIDLIYYSDELASPQSRSVRMWKRLSPTVRVHTVRSSHLGLITHDLPALAQQMRACLDSSNDTQPARMPTSRRRR